jgi:hypothetical protein
MTDKQFNRFMQLSDKMTAAKEKAGRTYTDTADLSPSERREYRLLRDMVEEANEEYREQQRINAGPQYYPSYT